MKNEKTQLKNIAKLHKLIERSVFYLDAPLGYYRNLDAIIALANSVHAYDGDSENLWFIGDGCHCYLADLIAGAYWHFAEWHGGQNSKGYSALCALGQVYSPGCEGSDNDNAIYIALHNMAENTFN